MLKCEKAVMDRLMLDAMKFKIVRYCDSNLDCSNRCFIRDLCEEYHAPNIHYLDDWKDEKSGEWKSFTKVIATNVEFLESANSTPSVPEEPQYNPPEGFGDDIGYNTVDDDDVPF